MKNGPYILLVAPDNYPGKKYRNRYAYEHHLVYWRKNGQIVPKGYEIHHKNGDHHDNRSSNLELLTAQEHRNHHGRLATKAAQASISCKECDVIIPMRKRELNMKLKANKHGVFCSRQCSGKYTGRKIFRNSERASRNTVNV